MGGLENEPDVVGEQDWILGMWGLSSWEMLRRGCSGLGMWGKVSTGSWDQPQRQGGVTGGARGGRRRDPRAALEKNIIQGPERRQVDEQYLMMPLPASGPSQMMRPSRVTPLLTHSLTCLQFTDPVWEKQLYRCPAVFCKGFMGGDQVV